MELLDVVGADDGSCKRLGGGTIHPDAVRSAVPRAPNHIIIRDVGIFRRLRLVSFLCSLPPVLHRKLLL